MTAHFCQDNGCWVTFHMTKWLPQEFHFPPLWFHSWSCFCHFLASNTMTTLTCQAWGTGWKLVSILLPYLAVYFFLTLLVQVVPMWICLLDFPTQSLWVSFLPWALFHTVGGGRAGLHGQDWDLDFGHSRMWEHNCQGRANPRDTCLKVDPELGYQADREDTNLSSKIS